MSDEGYVEPVFGTLDSLLSDSEYEDIKVEPFDSPDEPELTDSIREEIENPDIFQETLDQIESVDEYSWSRGSMGLDYGVEWMNEAFRGLNPGLHLFAGSANVGKSSILMQLKWNIVHANQYQTEDHPRVPYCIYFSLDDTANDLLPRIIALDQKITINQALFPKALKEPSIIEKREKGIQALKDNVKYFTMKDSNAGVTIEYIYETTKRYVETLEASFPDTYQVVVFIDNFHDVQVADERFFEDNARFDHVADRLTGVANEFNVPILCSSEFRKINVHKRPQIDDIKSTGKIAYEAKTVMLLYNEYGTKNESADIYWELADANNPEIIRKMPIVEFNVAKNKMGQYKGVQFMEFIPEMAHMSEVPKEDRDYYMQKLRG